MSYTSEVGSFKCQSFPSDVNAMAGEIANLFTTLKRDLAPMDKRGPMSGPCEIQTDQMERFLKHYFQFENTSGEYIVQGVKSFTVGQPPSLANLQGNVEIKFPNGEHPHPFAMTIEEIREWQKSFVVYADGSEHLSIDKHFLNMALQGHSEQGSEAFRMKFVVRVSTCPILMEFDGEIIERSIMEQWPARVKLVSVTGVDFAGRIHDVDDIRTYVTNWRDVYLMDSSQDQPLFYNGRDFSARKNVIAQLDRERLYKDLIRMARLRLFACDAEKIEIVVETGIGLGVFAGRQIGIDDQTRSLSARAIKLVLEKDGSTFKHIRALIFAMPIFEIDESTSTFNCFVSTFRNGYHGSIPVLIADQDMHRLTVAIARQGFSVSELNPADSHGVFGEYWQNRGPAVEEKLALTTVGLLIQHHLFNAEHVLNTDNYKIIRFDDDQVAHTVIPLLPLDVQSAIQLTIFGRGMEWIRQWYLWILLWIFSRIR